MTSFVHQRENIYAVQIGDLVALGNVKYSVRKLAQGGMGRVLFLQRRPECDPGALCIIYRLQLAAKVILPSNLDEISREMFRRELTIWAGFRHPNILPLTEILNGDVEERIAVMEWCPGTLRDLLNRHRKFSLPQVIGAVRDVLSGLAYAYDSDGVLHLDLKPENILFNETSSVNGSKTEFMVSDWGTASVKQARLKELTDCQKLGDQYETFNNIGTLLYMSPERFQKGYPSSVASDMFSLGMMFFELLTGQLPFSANRHPVEQLLSGEYYHNTANELARQRIPTACHRIILRCLAPNPTDRPQSHRECVDEINRVCRHPTYIVNKVFKQF
jgi:serine/threonine protein kinase